MRRPLMALVIASTPLALGLARGDEPKRDLAKLQGIWTGKIGRNGETAVRLEIRGRNATYVMTRDGQTKATYGELKIDETARPKRLDWVGSVGPEGEKIPDALSIYKLDGDSFVYQLGTPGTGDRPAEFREGADRAPGLRVFTRLRGAEADDDAKKDDLAKIQGEWKTMTGPNKDRPVTFSIKERTIAVKFTTGDGDTLDLKGEINLNESASPRTIDFVKFKNNGEDMEDSHGLYKLDGDKLILCVAAPGEPRPGDFKAGEGDESPHLWTFTRPK